MPSLFTDRAIVSRAHHGFDHAQVALSVGVQKMVRSDLARFLVRAGIDSLSLNPDSQLKTMVDIAALERTPSHTAG